MSKFELLFILVKYECFWIILYNNKILIIYNYQI